MRAVPDGGSPPSGEARFQGRWLLVTRAIWALVAVLLFVVFALNLIAPALGSKTTLCPFSSACGYAPTTRQALQHAHISTAAFSIYLYVVALFDAMVTVGVSVLLFWKKSDRPSSWLASLLFLMMGGVLLAGDDNSMSGAAQVIAGVGFVFLALLCMGFFIATFPDGRLVPRWSWLAGSSMFIQGLLYQLPGALYLERWPAPLLILETLLAFGSPVFVQIYRYTRVATPTQRQQAKWVLFGLLSFVLLEVVQALTEAIFPSLNAPDSLYPLVSASLLPSLAVLPIPAGVVIAILRSRLWEIDTLINRTLVYGSLTASLALVYVMGVFSLQALFRLISDGNSELAVAVSTLIIVALFQPLRQRIQHGIDRRFYRRKYDAARTLAAFEGRLRDEVDLDRLTGDLLGVVQDTVQPTHVSLWLR